MKYYFHPDAELEFEDAIDYYEERQNGLGYDFSVEVFSVVISIGWKVQSGISILGGS